MRAAEARVALCGQLGTSARAGACIASRRGFGQTQTLRCAALPGVAGILAIDQCSPKKTNTQDTVHNTICLYCAKTRTCKRAPRDGTFPPCPRNASVLKSSTPHTYRANVCHDKQGGETRHVRWHHLAAVLVMSRMACRSAGLPARGWQQPPLGCTQNSRPRWPYRKPPWGHLARCNKYYLKGRPSQSKRQSYRMAALLAWDRVPRPVMDMKSGWKHAPKAGCFGRLQATPLSSSNRSTWTTCSTERNR